MEDRNYDIWGTNFNVPSIISGALQTVFGDYTMFPGIMDERNYLTNNNESLVSSIWEDLTGQTAQQREFAQQEYLQDKQNDYNTPANQLARLQSAGFSRQAAAQSVLGGQAVESAQAPQVSNATGGAAAGAAALGQAAQIPSAIESVKSASDASKAAAALDYAQANAVEKRTKIDTLNAASSLITAFVGAGMPEIGAGLMALDIVNGGENRVVEYLQAYDGIRMVDEKLAKLRTEHDLIIKDLNSYDDRIKQELDTEKALQLKAEKEAKVAEENARWQKLQNDEWEKCPGYNLPAFNQMRINQQRYGTHSQEYRDVGKAILDSSFAQNKGYFDAEVDTAYARFYNESLAKFEVDAAYAPYKSFIEQNEYLVKLLLDQCYKNTKNPFETLDNIIRMLVSSASGRNPAYPVKNPGVPKLNPLESK